MTVRNWKRIQPNSMQHAMRICLDYALHKHNRSVPRVAELIGKSEWVIYKWMSNGSMPSDLIRPFEFACGATYVTQYIAASAYKLLVDIPNGKKPENTDLLTLQTGFNEVINQLARFYQNEADATETVGALTTMMRDIAGHRENVIKTGSPEFDMFSEDQE